MAVIATALADVLIIEPKVFGDERGFFYESFNAAAFEAAWPVFAPFFAEMQLAKPAWPAPPVRVMLPALSPLERHGMLADMRGKMPPQAFDGVLQLAHEVLGMNMYDVLGVGGYDETAWFVGSQYALRNASPPGPCR